MNEISATRRLGLGKIREHYASYHNHKELMSWGAVVFFAVCVTGTAATLKVDTALTGSAKLMVSVLSGVWFSMTWIYVKAQEVAKKKAADYVAACFHLESNIMAHGFSEELSDPSVWSPRNTKASNDDSNSIQVDSGFVLPEIVEDHSGRVSGSIEEARSGIQFAMSSLTKNMKFLWSITVYVAFLSWIWMSH